MVPPLCGVRQKGKPGEMLRAALQGSPGRHADKKKEIRHVQPDEAEGQVTRCRRYRLDRLVGRNDWHVLGTRDTAYVISLPNCIGYMRSFWSIIIQVGWATGGVSK